MFCINRLLREVHIAEDGRVCVLGLAMLDLQMVVFRPK